jgi:hypothetical protein
MRSIKLALESRFTREVIENCRASDPVTTPWNGGMASIRCLTRIGHWHFQTITTCVLVDADMEN